MKPGPARTPNDNARTRPASRPMSAVGRPCATAGDALRSREAHPPPCTQTLAGGKGGDHRLRYRDPAPPFAGHVGHARYDATWPPRLAAFRDTVTWIPSGLRSGNARSRHSHRTPTARSLGVHPPSTITGHRQCRAPIGRTRPTGRRSFSTKISRRFSSIACAPHPSRAGMERKPCRSQGYGESTTPAGNAAIRT